MLCLYCLNLYKPLNLMARNLLSRGTFINYYNMFLCIAHSTTNFLHLATPLVSATLNRTIFPYISLNFRKLTIVINALRETFLGIRREMIRHDILTYIQSRGGSRKKSDRCKTCLIWAWWAWLDVALVYMQ